MRILLLRASLVVALLASMSCAQAARVHEDAGTIDASIDGAVDAATDGGGDAATDGAVDAATDASHDGGALDASTDTDGGIDACVPPPCAAPPPGCHYEGGTSCTCGTLVCACPSTPPASCCYADADCPGSLAGERCVGELCGPSGAAGAGMCAPAPAKGECWEDADCAAGELCMNVALCPCGALCLIADHPGACVADTLF